MQNVLENEKALISVNVSDVWIGIKTASIFVKTA